MRKSSFHACWSQIGTGTCDMCLTCDGQVRSTKERKREIQENPTPPLAENLRRTERGKEKNKRRKRKRRIGGNIERVVTREKVRKE
jgi:hypothetical protein